MNGMMALGITIHASISLHFTIRFIEILKASIYLE
jgi:hypothetical protein